jgi:hypothetical protein
MPTLAQDSSLGEVASIIHAATLLGPSAWGREPMPEAHVNGNVEDRLKSQLIELFGILHARKIPYVLVGGIAMLAYVEGRNTKDVDLILALDSLAAIPEITIQDQNREFARGKFGDLPVDVLFTSNPLFKQVQDQHTLTHRFLEMDVRVATIEGLILLKLFALPSLYRQGQGQRIGLYENDVYTLCLLGRPAMEPLLQTLAKHVDPPALAELRNIVGDIQRRIARVEQVNREDESSRGGPAAS